MSDSAPTAAAPAAPEPAAPEPGAPEILRPSGEAIPVVRVVRNGFVESVHHGSLVITAPDGSVLSAIGDVTSPVFPRSSNKPFQAATALASGARLAGQTLALAAASHSGEPRHVNRVLGMLAEAGLTEDDLGCPPDLPLDESARDAVIASGGGAARRYMNCSGKHAGMLAACVAAGWDTATYLDPEHPLQQAITARVTALAGEAAAAVGVDGCGAPLLALSLTALARAFGRVNAAPEGSAEKAVTQAMRSHPFMVAGTGRDDTLLMQAHDGLLVKGGAEGVHCAALADGTAIAVKISDGAARARMPLLTAALAHLGLSSPTLDELATSPVLGGGRPVGNVEVIPAALPW